MWLLINYITISVLTFVSGFIVRKYLTRKSTHLKPNLKSEPIENRKCQKYIDAYYCRAFFHPEWFSDKKPYHLGSKEDCKICKHFK